MGDDCTLDFLVQGVNEANDHLSAIKGLFSIPKVEKAIISVAFARKSGVELLSDELQRLADKTTLYIGIRNGITSIQALSALLDLGCKVFVVDTGKNSILYHPKVFLVKNDSFYKLIVGSANLTRGGLVGNIEVSSSITTPLSDVNVNKLIQTLTALPSRFPNNVSEISDKTDVLSLEEKGLLADETIYSSDISTNREEDGEVAEVPPMDLYNVPIPQTVHRAPMMTRKVLVTKNQWILMWESGGLTERDLNIPHGKNTNKTGSMLLKKGNFTQIEQRSYFRNEVFQDLDWNFDVRSGKQHIERTQASFFLQIRGVNFGSFLLKISHNTKTDTASYRQNNAMTSIHWDGLNDSAKKAVSNDNLLGATMRLYKSYAEDGATPVFLIEID